MANSNVTVGLQPIDELGKPWFGVLNLYYVPASQGNLFRGDPLIPLGGTDNFGVPAVGIATAGAGNFLVGPMVSIASGPAAGGNATIPITRDLPLYHQGGQAGYVLVADDPDIRFAVQEDSNGAVLSPAVSAFANANLVAGAGNTITGISGWQLQSSSVANAANPTFQLKILALRRSPDNAIGAFADWIVRINLHSILNPNGI